MSFRLFCCFIISFVFSIVCLAENPENGMLLKEGSLALPDSVIVRINPNSKDILFSDNYKQKNYAKSPVLFKKALAKELGFRKASEIRKNVFVLKGKRINLSKISEKFKSNHFILIEHNFIVEAHDKIPSINDTFSSYQWGLYDPINKMDINIEKVWSEFEPLIKNEVIVAVIDTGVDCYHEDLVLSCFTNEGEIPNNNIDDDGNGYIDDIQGWNFYDNSNSSNDDNFHGTHVAGIIASEKNNQKGIAGVTSKTKIIPIKVLSNEGRGSIDNVISGIEYALKMKEKGYNIRVLNLSLGSTNYSVELYNAIKEAKNAGITVVISAGNEDGIVDSFPASYDLDNIVSVAAHSQPDHFYYKNSKAQPLASFSNNGKIQVDISAPGTDIMSCHANTYDSYLEKSGTSMAAPFVSGAVAVLAGLYPNDDPETYISWLLEGSAYFPMLENYTRADGILDVYGSATLAKNRDINPLKTVTFSGYVADTIHAAKIEGLPNIEVKLKVNEETFTQQSDNNGFFVFKDIPVGANYIITAKSKEIAFKTIQGTVKPHNYFLTLQPKSITLSGRLLNTIVPISLANTNSELPKGAPNKKIILTTTGSDSVTHEYKTKTDKKGEFFFYNLKLGDSFSIRLDDDEFNDQTGCTYFGRKWNKDTSVDGYGCKGKIIYGANVLIGTPSKKITIKVKTTNNSANPEAVIKITTKKDGSTNYVTYTQRENSIIVTRVARDSKVKIEVISNISNYSYPVTTFTLKKNKTISLTPIITPESKLLPPDLSAIKRGVLRITLEKFQYATKKSDGSGKQFPYKYEIKIIKKHDGKESVETYETTKINNRLEVEEKTDYLINYRVKLLNKKNKVVAKTDWGQQLTLRVISK